MSKADRANVILGSMTRDERVLFLHDFLKARKTDDERLEMFDMQDDVFCMDCGAVYTEEAHDCPNEPTCVCEHKASEHDEEDEEHPCLATDGKGKPCDCKGFEPVDDDEDEEKESLSRVAKEQR